MNGQTLVARVAVAAAVYSIDRPYDYSVPAAWAASLTEGQRVIVPFGAANRKTEGIVLEVAEVTEPRQLKAIARQECANMDQFHYVVVNDEVADAAERLRAVILSRRCLQENCRFIMK